MSTLVETRHLKKYFKVSKGMLHAVDDVDLTIEEKMKPGRGAQCGEHIS